VRPDSHLRLSIAVVALFMASGLWLEAMYGLRAEGWLDDPLRREFLRLGHAHGGLLGVVNVALAWTLERLQTPPAWGGKIRVAALLGALLVGLGFMLGGLMHGPTDPGVAVLAVPAGAMLLLAALVATALLRSDDHHS
jgi:heme A synthase